MGGSRWTVGGEGKPATCFTSTATLHGGQESTLITMWIPLVHLGMIVVGVPYSVSELMTTQRGGTPYGATTMAGPTGELMPNEVELTVARAQGRRLSELTQRLRG